MILRSIAKAGLHYPFDLPPELLIEAESNGEEPNWRYVSFDGNSFNTAEHLSQTLGYSRSSPTWIE
jgi:hypothetical protein